MQGAQTGEHGAMRITILVVSCSVAVATLIVACDQSPTRPTSPAVADSPPGVVIHRLEILGTGSVAPGQCAQLNASAHHSDGSTADITATANWRSSNAAVLSISASGLATGQANGDAVVSVSVAGGRSAS